MAEEMALEDAGKAEHHTKTTILSLGEPAFTDAELRMHVWPSDVKPASLSSAQIPAAVSQPSNVLTRHAYGVKDWANTLFGSNPPITLANKSKRKHKNPRRLGVCTFSHANYRLLIVKFRRLIWDPMLSKIRCLYGYAES